MDFFQSLVTINDNCEWKSKFVLQVLILYVLFFRLEPLLARIKDNRLAVLCPIIDHISAETLAYSGSDRPADVGGFWWSLHFRWDPVPEEYRDADPTKPIRFVNLLVGLFKMLFYE